MSPAEVLRLGGHAWAQVREKQLRPLYVAAVAAFAPDQGSRVLHADCGTGTALEVAARAGAEVFGCDASAGLLAAARDLLPDADLRLADLTELPYDRGCFDSVMAFEGIQYAGRPAAAIAELARVTRPGGVVAIGLWHNWSGREASTFLNAVRGQAPMAPPSLQPIRDLYRLREVMVEAGLDVYASAEIAHRYDFDDLDSAWQAMTVSRHVSHAIDMMGPEAAHAIFIDNFAHRQRPDGTLQQDNLFQYALGRATS